MNTALGTFGCALLLSFAPGLGFAQQPAPAPVPAPAQVTATAPATATATAPVPATAPAARPAAAKRTAQLDAGEPRAGGVSSRGDTPGVDTPAVEAQVNTSPAGSARGTARTPSQAASAPRSQAAGGRAGADGGAAGTAGAAGAAGAAARRGATTTDRLNLNTATVTGDREQPKVMYVVPWKSSNIGDLSGKPMNSLLDEALSPVDREEFKRQVAYYDAVRTDAPHNGAPPAANQGER